MPEISLTTASGDEITVSTITVRIYRKYRNTDQQCEKHGHKCHQQNQIGVQFLLVVAKTQIAAFQHQGRIFADTTIRSVFKH